MKFQRNRLTSKQEYDNLGNDWVLWVIWVHALRDSVAHILHREYARHPKGKEVVMPMTLAVSAMLLGYAIECALKALWVKKGNKIAQGGKLVGVPQCGDHELLQLSRAVDFSLTEKEKDLLVRLSKYVKFEGRYPVATSHKHTNFYSDLFVQSDFRTAQSILSKIEKVLGAT
jgi:hypothetical protein